MTRRNMMSRRTFGLLGGSALLAGAELLASCGSDGSTAGKRIALTTRAGVESLSFTNAYDFQVELSRALVSIGPLRFLEGAPVTRRDWFDRVLGIQLAHAHPGHYVEGGVLGEMLVPTSVDLTAGPTDLGVEPGVTGSALSGQFSFEHPPTGPFAGALDGRIVLLEGEATKGALLRAFRAFGRIGDVVDDDGEPVIQGCEFEGGELDGDGVVDVILRPSVWLDQVDFAEVPDSAVEDLVELTPGERPHRALVRGLLKASAYHFRFTPDAG